MTAPATCGCGAEACCYWLASANNVVLNFDFPAELYLEEVRVRSKSRTDADAQYSMDATRNDGSTYSITNGFVPDTANLGDEKVHLVQSRAKRLSVTVSYFFGYSVMEEIEIYHRPL